MQLFLYIILQLSSFIISFAIPVAITLAIIGFLLVNKKVLKAAFIASIVTLVAHVVGFGTQIYQAKMGGQNVLEIFSNIQNILDIFLSVGIPVTLSVVLIVLTNQKYKKVS